MIHSTCANPWRRAHHLLAAVATILGAQGLPAQGARPQAPGAAQAAPVQATIGCRECKKPLTDPFDQAIGTCEDCRAKLDRGSQAATAVTNSAPGKDKNAHVGRTPNDA